MMDTTVQQPRRGRTTLILVCLLVIPFYLELPLAAIQHMVSRPSAGSLGYFAGSMAFLGSIPASFAAIAAVITLFRPQVSWDRKGLIWLIVLSAFVCNRLALTLLARS